MRAKSIESGLPKTGIRGLEGDILKGHCSGGLLATKPLARPIATCLRHPHSRLNFPFLFLLTSFWVEVFVALFLVQNFINLT